MKDKEERIARAVAYFKEGYNCSQSVVAAFADLYGFTHEQALHISASFGGGIGRMRLTCGAVCGMWQNIDICHCPGNPLRGIVGVETGCTGQQPGRSPYGGLLCQASLSEDGRVGSPHFC